MGRPGPQASGSESEGSEEAEAEAEAASCSAASGGFFRKIDEFDQRLSLRVHGSLSAVPRSVLQGLEYSGDGLLIIPLTCALWLAPVLLDEPDLRHFLFNLCAAFFLDLALIGAIKSVVRRPRPIYNVGMYLVLAVDEHSLPSGHSSRAILIATFFWLHLPMWGRLLAPRAESWAYGASLPSPELCLLAAVWAWGLATAASRVLLGRHYVLDVLLGSVVGVLEALFAHCVLAVPQDVSQGLHDSLLRAFKRA